MAQRTATRLDWQRVRDLASRLTTPLLPDDYLSLINPLWSARELRGRVEKVVPETDDAATLRHPARLGLVLRPRGRASTSASASRSTAGTTGARTR